MYVYSYDICHFIKKDILTLATFLKHFKFANIYVA